MGFVTWGLAGAFAAAIAYGAATVLQAVGAQRTKRSNAPDRALMLQLIHSAPYLAGIALDAVGFALSLAALRTEPLFTVQAIVASSLAVTALLAVVVLRTHPAPIEWIALGFVTAGLSLLALSAQTQKPAGVDYVGRLGLLLGVGFIGVVTAGLARRRSGGSSRDAWALGCLAGLMYGAGGIGARVLHEPHSVAALLADPALWALIGAGVLGLLVYAMALQRGAVTVVTSAVVVTETIVPAALGITLLGDRPAHGRAVIAAVGFSLSVLGSLALARFGEAPPRGDAERESLGPRFAADGG